MHNIINAVYFTYSHSKSLINIGVSNWWVMSKTNSSFTPRSNVIYIYRILFVCIIYRGFQMLLVVLLLSEAIFLLIKRIITAELFAAGLVAFANSQCFLSLRAKSASRCNSWLGAEAASLRAGTLCMVGWPSGESLCLLKWNVCWLTTWWPGDVWVLLGCTWSSLNCLCRRGGCVTLIYFWSISLSIFGRVTSPKREMTWRWIHSSLH